MMATNWNKWSKNQKSNSIGYWSILLCTNKPNIRKIGSKLREPMWFENKANLRDLIAATGLVILLQLDSNPSLCDQIWWMTSKNNRAPFLSSFVHHFKSIGDFKLELQSRITQFGSKWTIILSCVNLEFYGWPWKTIGHLVYTTLSFLHHFKAIS